MWVSRKTRDTKMLGNRSNVKGEKRLSSGFQVGTISDSLAESLVHKDTYVFIKGR